MEPMLELMAGSMKQAPWGWALLATAILSMVKIWPVVKQLAVSEHTTIRQEYVNEIKELRLEIKELRDENKQLRQQLTEVQLELAGSRSQHLSEQAAAIRLVPAIREAVEDVAKGAKNG